MRVADMNIEIVFTGERLAMNELLHLAELAENLGFSGIWMAEAFRSSMVPLTAIASRTSRARLGTNVAQWTRSLPNLELAAGDLNEFCGGRFKLGLGSSTKEWNENWFGIVYQRPLQRMREYVEALRLLWTAGPQSPVSYEGEFFKIRDYLRFNGPLEMRPDIYLAAARPRMARLAGEIGDGVNFNSMLSARYIGEVLLPALDEGAKQSGRRAGDLDRGVSLLTAVADDPAEAVEICRHQVAFYCIFTTYFEGVMQLHDMMDDYIAIREKFDAGDIMGAISRVPDRMVETLTLAGTPATVREQVARYSPACSFVMLSPPSFMLEDSVVLRNQENIVRAFGE